MKSFNDVAAAVSRAARNEPEPPAAASAPMRPAHACAAAGCPLAGTITDSTTGGGPWECRFHKFRDDGVTADEVTTWIRNQIADGINPHLIGRTSDPSPTVAAMRLVMRGSKGRIRTPGEDDE